MAGKKLVNEALCFKEKNATKYEMVDEIKRQYKEFQTELILEDFAVASPKVRGRQTQVSCWRNAYSKLQMPLDDTEKPTEGHTVCYWSKIEIFILDF